MLKLTTKKTHIGKLANYIKKLANNGLAKHANKCCYDNKNIVAVIDGYSSICGVCGRYTYDYVGNQATILGSISILGYEKYHKILKRARSKVELFKSKKK